MPGRLSKSAVSVVAPVAQLDRASASGAEGHRFESCRARQFLPNHSRKHRLGLPSSSVRWFSNVVNQTATNLVAARQRTKIPVSVCTATSHLVA